MTFHEAEPDENFPIRKFESTNHTWEWGLTPMLFGVRVRAGLVGSMACEVDYCCGPGSDEQMLWLGFLSGLMLQLPESITPAELTKLLPRQTVKPLSLDKECQEKLFKLAEHLAANSIRDNQGCAS
jgi:hypothetical protein